MNALIFDCDGVLADTERDGHLPAFNATFEEFGLPVRWSESEYARRLLIGGGKERMASLLDPEFVRAAGLPADEAGQRAAVAKWHERKTAIFKEIVAAGRLTPRSGVARLSRELDQLGWKLAVASTSARESVVAVLETAVGAELAARFEVFAGDVVPKKKPAPDIYLHALAELGVAAGDALVVEDSRNGLLAAVGAGLRCLVTLSSFTREEPMDEALVVLTCLGDPGGERSRVLHNRTAGRFEPYVTVDDIRACLASDAAPAARALGRT